MIYTQIDSRGMPPAYYTKYKNIQWENKRYPSKCAKAWIKQRLNQFIFCKILRTFKMSVCVMYLEGDYCFSPNVSDQGTFPSRIYNSSHSKVKLFKLQLLW